MQALLLQPPKAPRIRSRPLLRLSRAYWICKVCDLTPVQSSSKTNHCQMYWLTDIMESSNLNMRNKRPLLRRWLYRHKIGPNRRQRKHLSKNQVHRSRMKQICRQMQNRAWWGSLRKRRRINLPLLKFFQKRVWQHAATVVSIVVTQV